MFHIHRGFYSFLFFFFFDEPDPLFEKVTAHEVKKPKKNKKGEEQLTAEEEAELEKQKVSTKQ